MRTLIFLCAAVAMAAPPALIPAPVSVTTCAEEFTFDKFQRDRKDPDAYLDSRLPFGESPAKFAIRQRKFDNPEAYSLSISASGVTIEVSSREAEVHAIETLVQSRSGGNRYPCIRIEDQPRFPWRGLLLDVSRHFMPLDTLKHTLDRMAAVKLNVLHLHLADDQGIRIESKQYPLLQQKASGGLYYTQLQIRELITYAHQRGIKIVPEFDFPGHATAWLTAYPALASAPGPYKIERRIGIFDPAFDPSNPKTYEFIEGFLTEMSSLFGGHDFHLGGDEVTGKHWDANPRIQAFKKTKGLTTNHDLQAYFEDRMYAIIKKLGGNLILWDEAIHPKAPPGVIYQAWRGPNALLASAFLQHPTLVSYGFYLDWGLSTEQLYANKLNGVLPDETDPILKRLNPLIRIPAARPAGMLTEAEAANRLGGEAALWTEFTTPANIDTRLWPRAAVVAERLWSQPEQSKDIDDLLSRIHTLFPQPQAKPLEDLLEPGKYVYRHLSHKYTVDSPMDQLVDRLPPESYRAQQFNRAPRQGRAQLNEWNTTTSKELAPDLQADAKRAVKIGLEAFDYLDGKPAPAGWVAASLATLKALSDNHREIVIAICPGVTALVKAYASAARSAPQ